MATAKYTTLGEGLLNAGITDVATSLTLQSGQGATFPTAGDFWIRISAAEIVKVGARTGDTLSSLTRGQEGTTATSHASGAKVIEIVSAAMLDQIRKDLVQTGTDAAQPAAEKEGIIYLPNNGLYLYRDDGSALRPWGPIQRFTKPVAGDFAWINQGTAQLITAQGPLIIESPAQTGSSWHILKKAAPSTPYTITAAFGYHPSGDGDTRGGLVFRESATEELYLFVIYQTGAIQLFRNTSPTVNLNTVFDKTDRLNFAQPIVWLRMTDNGTNLTWEFSLDGQNWGGALTTLGRTEFMAGGPDEVGWALNHANASGGSKPYLYLYSWAQF